MPEYSYMCDSCQHKWSVYCSIKEYKQKVPCPECANVESVYRDYEEDNIYGAYSYSVSEAKTLGHYADKQSKKHGKAKVEDMVKDVELEIEPTTIKRKIVTKKHAENDQDKKIKKIQFDRGIYKYHG